MPATPILDLPRFLTCLAAVESGNKDGAIAERNNQPLARGRFQITEAVWFQHTNRPWKLAHNYMFAQVIAERHLHWLNTHLLNISIDEVHHRPFALAWAWRAGLTSWNNRDKITETHRKSELLDYSNRVLNLYFDKTP